ncbi:MAG: IS630 family transposase [Syntrophales bacterium LBB04]|nr:IS630 family transposase [Syntrophales bacterium LBB04]
MRDLRIDPDPDDHPVFPPDVVVRVKALACELPSESGIPLSRWSTDEIAREAIQRGIVADVSGSTVWRWLGEDAIKPWHYRSWIFPRDPQFEQKAGRVLDLYQGIWGGLLLGPDDFVISADEKTSIQARHRRHISLGAQKGTGQKVEFEYRRKGALSYLAAWDVRRAKLFGRCEAKTGIIPFTRLVQDVMACEPYRSARRVFWILDNGSSHRGLPSVNRLQGKWPQIVVVHLPIHASWLNQIEIYFSILQRKVLTPNDFCSLVALTERILCFQQHYEKIARPFEWKFTRKDLSNLLHKLSSPSLELPHAA